MHFNDFKVRIEELVSSEEKNQRQIQALITNLYKNKVIPHLGSLQKFVVRCSSNKPGEVFRNISRCSYNPNPTDIPIQRCNYPRQQVFYCSMFSDTDFATSSMTCLAETAWEHIEDFEIARTYFTLSRWQIKRPLKLWVLPFSDLSCEKNRDFKSIKANMEEFVKKLFNQPNEIIQSLKYISEIFCKRENKKIYHKISSAFYNSLLFYQKFMNDSYDGLIYPSANTDGSGMNVVLKKELIDEQILYCDFAIMYSMQRNPNNLKNLSFMPASNEAYPNENGDLNFHTIF